MRLAKSLAFAVPLLLLCPASPAGAARLGPELRLNAEIAGVQRTPVLAARPDGSFLAVWETQYSQGIVARLFAADGRPLDEDILVRSGHLGEGRYATQPQAAALAGGGFAVVWREGAKVWARLLDAAGLPRGPTAVLLSTAEEASFLHPPSVAATPDGGFVVAWQHVAHDPFVPVRRESVRWRRYGEDGSAAGAVKEIEPHDGIVADWPRVAVDAAGGVALTWQSGQLWLARFDAQGKETGAPAPISAGSDHGGLARFDADGTLEVVWQSGSAFGVRRFAASREPLGDTKWLHHTDEPFTDFIVLHAAVADGAGRRLLVWSQESTRDPDSGVHARLYDAAWEPLGGPIMLNAAAWAAQLDGAAAGLPDGFVTAWAGGEHESAVLPIAGEGRCSGDGSFFGIFGRFLDPDPAGAPASALLLADGRFALEVEWRNGGASGAARPVPHSDESGAFWFFSPDNPELLVKLLDGRGVNGHFWIFHAAATSVDYTLTVTDLDTGRRRSYRKRAGPLESAVDTAAFAAPGASAPGKSVCTEGIPGLYLAFGHFHAEVRWRDPRTGTMSWASGQSLTRDGGLFFFFGNANPELLVKMVDGRAVNGRWWFFHAALTDLEYEIVLRSTDTGEERTYRKPAGVLGGGADVAAF